VIREDQELLTELARLNSAGAAEQAHYAQRLIAAGKRLQRRADAFRAVIVEGEIVTTGSLDLPASTIEPHSEQ
jgi:hypothetical protein